MTLADIGRCPRCSRFLIAENLATHDCKVPLKGVREVVLDWIIDGVQNEDEDLVQVAMGLDGFLYRLILCKHNPPHAPPDDRYRRTDPTKRRQNLYPQGLLVRNT